MEEKRAFFKGAILGCVRGVCWVRKVELVKESRGSERADKSEK